MTLVNKDERGYENKGRVRMHVRNAHFCLKGCMEASRGAAARTAAAKALQCGWRPHARYPASLLVVAGHAGARREGCTSNSKHGPRA